MAEKVCAKCGEPLKGFGDACSSCRRCSAQGCVSCGDFSAGAGEVCDDCKAGVVAGGARGKEWDTDGNLTGESSLPAFRSEEEIALRKTAVASEKAWEGIGLEPGLWVFRIESFKVVPWPRDKYGKFHEGDSYIVLQAEGVNFAAETGKESEKLEYNIHFWLGKYTSTDEKGTAAYKTVELDNFFDDRAIQHREVQGSESPAFLSYFRGGVEYLPGGVESGFRIAQQDIFASRLTQVRRNGKNEFIFEEEAVDRKSLNHRDAFILEKGNKIYVWCGDKASPFVKNAANLEAERRESQSNGKRTKTHEIDNEFWDTLGGQGEVTDADEVDQKVPVDFGEGVLYSIQVDETRKLTVEELGRGDLHRSQLDSTGVMMVDTRTEIFLWLGKDCSGLEKACAFQTASNYLKMQGRSADKTAITILKEGSDHKSKAWCQMFPST